MNLDIDKGYTGKVMTISGNVGNGKNTLAVALIRVMSKKCIHGVKLETQCQYCIKYGISEKERKLRAYANFPLDLPDVNCKFLETVDDFLNIKKSKQHSVCILDEPNAWGFDSRGSGQNQLNKKIGYKIQHTRKYNMDIIFLTQLWSMVDLRGKRLSSNTIVAIEPTEKEFQYGWYKMDEIIPLTIRKTYARRYLFPYFDSSHIVGFNEEDNSEDETNTSQIVIEN